MHAMHRQFWSWHLIGMEHASNFGASNDELMNRMARFWLASTKGQRDSYCWNGQQRLYIPCIFTHFPRNVIPFEFPSFGKFATNLIPKFNDQWFASVNASISIFPKYGCRIIRSSWSIFKHSIQLNQLEMEIESWTFLIRPLKMLCLRRVCCR